MICSCFFLLEVKLNGWMDKRMTPQRHGENESLSSYAYDHCPEGRSGLVWRQSHSQMTPKKRKQQLSFLSEPDKVGAVTLLCFRCDG